MYVSLAKAPSLRLLPGFGFFALESLHLGRGEHRQLRPALLAVSS